MAHINSHIIRTNNRVSWTNTGSAIIKFSSHTKTCAILNSTLRRNMLTQTTCTGAVTKSGGFANLHPHRRIQSRTISCRLHFRRHRHCSHYTNPSRATFVLRLEISVSMAMAQALSETVFKALIRMEPKAKIVFATEMELQESALGANRRHHCRPHRIATPATVRRARLPSSLRPSSPCFAPSACRVMPLTMMRRMLPAATLLVECHSSTWALIRRLRRQCLQPTRRQRLQRRRCSITRNRSISSSISSHNSNRSNRSMHPDSPRPTRSHCSHSRRNRRRRLSRPRHLRAASACRPRTPTTRMRTCMPSAVRPCRRASVRTRPLLPLSHRPCLHCRHCRRRETWRHLVRTPRALGRRRQSSVFFRPMKVRPNQ